MSEQNEFFEVNTPEGSGGGGGGCFPAGTKINTPKGYRNIEDIVVGDLVYGFNARTGSVCLSQVLETTKHSWEEVHEASPLVVLVHDKGELCLTANHWIYRSNSRVGEYANFDEARDFKVGDQLTTEYDEVVTISEVKDGPEYDFVYNLEVEGVHTYIASGIRVHNGGGGGKGGGAQHVHYEAPNDLRSRAVARVLEVISEGEIVGLADNVNPAKSIFFDNTPVQNNDDTYNFNSIVVEQRTGLPTQDYMPGFPLVEAEFVVTVEVKQTGSVTRTVSAPNIDALRVTIQLPNGLYRQDVNNGDVYGSSVTFHIDTRVQGGTWTTAITDTITGKTMTAYERAYRVEKPMTGTGFWEVRVVRDTADSGTAALVDKTVFSRYTEIQDLKLEYENTAYVGVAVDAESTGGRIPRRSYDVYGLKVKVPSNYNPTTRVYTGTWNGTFQTAWTDNPAWVLYDLLTNTRYGLGEYIKDYNVDKFSFYNAAVYNDTLVNDGKGLGTFEPRFTFNAQIMSQDDSWKLLQSVASTMRASIFIGGGIVKLIQDRPASAVKLVSRANVLEGNFEYSSSAARARHTACNVVYNDPNDSYLPKIVTVEDSTGVARYGYNLVEVAAFGCTSEGQARRLGLWTLDTELNSTEMLTYRAGLNQVDLEPGDIIKVMDADYASIEQAGKIISATTTSITVDRPVNITNTGWTLDMVSSDGSTIVTKTLTNAIGNNQTVLTWSGAVVVPSKPWSDWMVTGTVQPRQFRVVTIREADKGVVEITALLYDSAKYARVEAGVYIPTPSYFVPPTNVPVNAVTDITWNRESITDPSGVVKRFLRVSWTPDASSFISGYTFRWSRNNGVWTNGSTQQPYTIIPADFSGSYVIAVYAYNAYGTQSPVATGSYVLDLTDTPPTSDLAAVSGLKVTGITPATTTFRQQDLVVEWTNSNVNNPASASVLQDFEVTVRDPLNSAIVLRTEFVTDTSYNYTYSKNKEDNPSGVRRYVIIRVRCRDTFQRMSASAEATFTNNTPPAPSLTVQTGVDLIFASMNISTEPDIKGYYVFASTTSGFTPSAANVIYKGDAPFASMPAIGGTNYYLKAAAFDDFDDTIGNLLISSQVSGTPSKAITQFNDYSFTGLTFKPNDPSANSVSWTAAVAIKTAGGTGVGTTWNVAAGSAAWTVGTMYIYYKEGNTTLSTTTTLTTAIAADQLIIATYKGGTDLTVGDGKAFIDGNTILAGTVGASQLVAGSAVITGEAQLGTAVINAAAIKDGVLTNAKIVDATIDTLKLKNGSVVSFVAFKGSNSNTITVSSNTPVIGSLLGVSTDTSFLRASTPSPIGVPGPFNGVLHFYVNVERNSNIPFTATIDAEINFYNSAGVLQSTKVLTASSTVAGAQASQIPFFMVLSNAPGEITEIGKITAKYYASSSAPINMTIKMLSPAGYQLLNLR